MTEEKNYFPNDVLQKTVGSKKIPTDFFPKRYLINSYINAFEGWKIETDAKKKLIYWERMRRAILKMNNMQTKWASERKEQNEEDEEVEEVEDTADIKHKDFNYMMSCVGSFMSFFMLAMAILLAMQTIN
jgi:hypothetical protein